ncbi:hypothetical protein COS78_01185 [Candidatus Shapirobacteria bacterium CG06_land_8_20_14_3_00_40_12]|uniref:BrnT family toxin n=2 Tax=Candidatus Shapironibacteriota TaxID=1752721 RepID=A0A2M7TSQ5_9BACT|nr:MAG: hypothetical protein COS78_01185 [Candidatus Shapirobacteria bacterium CG06_land_8_20_14_3_00_40_12]PIZ58830.1 MAG: hypothetical protein COY20_02925 [Candidatus Shapirobacteria bacterium CG_4_10_14_0_2_um_filter_40_12]
MILADLEGFDWDGWNKIKNLVKHQVENKECEDVFFNQPKLVEFDKKHSTIEKRYKILGVTDRKRQLLVVFTIRNKKIRIISARDQSKKERLQLDQLSND